MIFAMNNGAFLNSFDRVFLHYEVTCTNKTEIKDGLQYINESNYIYISGFSNQLETQYSTFSKSFCLLEALSL